MNMRKIRLLCCAVVVFLLANVIPARTQQSRSFDLLQASASDIQAAVAAGALNYERLVQLYLNRIEAYDKNGPKLNAVLQINPRALEIARSLDEERKTKGLRSPLHGIPIAVKDSVDVADMPSASGSLAFAGNYPAVDATVIRKLREAGAIIFLKTNLDEFNFSARGLSSLGGQVLNPFDLKRSPGGSSAGTGVAINAGFAAIGIGTETGASIRSPASNNSLVGIAATQGLVSRAGVLAVTYTQDRVGVHARSVADAALLLSYMRGFDAEDLFTWESLGKLDPLPYTAFLKEQALRGARVGVLRDLFRKGEQFADVNGRIDKEIDAMQQVGAIIVDGLSTGMDLVGLFPVLRVGQNEFRLAFEAYARHRGAASPVKNVEELIANGGYLPGTRNSLQQSLRIQQPDFDPDYLARIRNRATIKQILVDVMDKYRVDALIYPFKSLAAPPLGTSDRGLRDNPISAITGLPAIIVPAGVDAEGLPISLEFLGRPFSEPSLIRLANAYEAASRKRILPPTTPHLPGDVFPY
jgi:Asp-tRNA(Asn)/Glu-tRNA(Gln) amidotransferase A subunit family amidase